MSYPDTLSRLEGQVGRLQDEVMQGARERDRLRSELNRAQDLVKKLTAALLPFTYTTLPHTRRTLIDFDRYGLRRSISPMEVAARNASRALAAVDSER